MPKRDLARALTLVALLASAPALALAAPTGADLASHPVLGGLEFEELEPTRGLVFQIQLGAEEDPQHADALTSEIGALYEELEAVFDRLVAAPAGFGDRSTRRAIETVVVLDSDTWLASRPAGMLPIPTGACFDAALGAIVTYDLDWPGSPRAARLDGLRRAYTRALLAAHGTEGADARLPGWIHAALPIWLAARLGDPEEDLESQRSGLIDELLEGGLTSGFVLGLEPLTQLAGPASLTAEARARTTETLESEHWTARRVDSLGLESALLFEHLLSDAARSEALLAHLGERYAGATGPLADDLAQLEQEFWAQLLTDERARDKRFDPRGLGGPAAFEAAVASLDLEAIDADAEAGGSSRDRLQMGLYRASQGRLAEARATLASSDDADMARNLAGIEALAELRHAWLEYLAGGADKLRIEHAGRSLTVDVTRVGRRSIFLGENPRGVRAVPIDQLDLGDQVERMQKEKPAFGDARARAWAQALAGGKWKRGLTTTEKRDAELVADLEAVAGHLERGRLLVLLERSADALTSADQDRLDAIRALLMSDHELVEANRGRLRERAEAILGARFDATELTSLSNAASVERAGERLTLSYDFKSPEQLLDWAEYASYSPEFVALLPELKTTEVTRAIEDDMLQVQGSTAFQNILAFGGPMKLTYEVSYRRTKKRSQAKIPELDYVYASICDDLAYQHLRTSHFGELDVVAIEREINEHITRDEPLSYKLGKTYRIELELTADGSARTRVDGKQLFEHDQHGLGAGRVAFLIHSDRIVRLHSITVEGRLAEDQAPLRRMWLDGQLGELGFQLR